MSRPTQAGSVSAFVAVLSVGLMALAGLAIDGGRALAARSQARAEAEQAARAGADQLSLAALHDGAVVVVPSRAVSAAQQELRRMGASGRVTVIANEVSVTVSLRDPTVVLGIVGIESIAVSATASAVPLHGVTKED